MNAFQNKDLYDVSLIDQPSRCIDTVVSLCVINHIDRAWGSLLIASPVLSILSIPSSMILVYRESYWVCGTDRFQNEESNSYWSQVRLSSQILLQRMCTCHLKEVKLIEWKQICCSQLNLHLQFSFTRTKDSTKSALWISYVPCKRRRNLYVPNQIQGTNFPVIEPILIAQI